MSNVYSDYFDQQVKDVDNWFKDNVVKSYKFDEDLDFEELVFGQSDSTIYQVVYRRFGGLLFVTGDIGSAVFNWYSSNSLSWMGGLGFGYFMGKCEASEHGRDFKKFSEDNVYRAIRENLKDPDLDHVNEEVLTEINSCDDFNVEYDNLVSEFIADLKSNDFREKRTELLIRIMHERDSMDMDCGGAGWIMWLAEHGAKYFGQDYWDDSYLFGKAPPHRAVGMWRGLHLASKMEAWWTGYKSAEWTGYKSAESCKPPTMIKEVVKLGDDQAPDIIKELRGSGVIVGGGGSGSGPVCKGHVTGGGGVAGGSAAHEPNIKNEE